jgi:hypothetical protein
MLPCMHGALPGSGLVENYPRFVGKKIPDKPGIEFRGSTVCTNDDG